MQAANQLSNLDQPPVVEQTLIGSPAQEQHTSGRKSHPGLLKRPQLLFMVALSLLDMGWVWAGYGIAHALLSRDPEILIGPFLEFWPIPTFHSLLLLGTFFSQRMYERRRPVSHLDESLKILIQHTFATLLSVALIVLFLSDFSYHRRLILLGWGIGLVLLVVGRATHAQIQWYVQSRGVGADRVLLVGNGDVAQIIMHRILSTPKLGFQIVGVIASGPTHSIMPLAAEKLARTPGHTSISPTGLPTVEMPILGHIADIPQVIEQFGVDEVIIGLPESSHQEIVGIISLCEREKVGIRVFPDVFQIMASEVSIGDLSGLPLLTMRDVALQGWKLTLKRGVDMVGSAIALIFLSPIMLLTAILIKLESPGPVFYTQERMGLDARPFKMIKFRSMVQDAEEHGPGWTTEGDPRRTRLGSLLRRIELDETPQFINVLLGNMSLVGPRPERPVYVEQFRQSIPRYMDRHREKGGMTGWAQVNGMRGDTSIAERIKYDLWYIENWSLVLDFKIMIRTVLQVIINRERNAY